MTGRGQDDVAWPPGDAETAALIRALGPASTPLGARETWPQALRTSIDLMLPAGAEIVLFWGEDYIAFYNDAYAPTIGDKHPRAMGRPASENWSELWDDLKPLLDSVRTTGRTVLAKDRPFYIERHGYGEQVFFDISYSPVRDEAGGVAGVLCIVSETTKRVMAARAVRASEARYRTLFNSIGQGFCVIEMIFDQDDRPVDYRFLELNPAFERQTGLIDAAGRTMRSLAPDHEAFWFETYGRIALTGEPERFESRAEALGRWFEVSAFRVGEPDERRVAILFEDVSERKRAEMALRDSEARLRAALQAGRMAWWIWDTVADDVSGSETLHELFGLREGQEWRSSKTGFSLIHPDDVDRHRLQIEEGLREGRGWHSVYRVVRPRDGRVVWLEERAEATRDLQGEERVTGLVWDITDEQQAAERQSVLLAELQHRTRNLLGVVRSITDRTLARSASPEEFRAAFRERLEALARVNGLLSRLNEGERVTFGELIRTELAGHGVTIGEQVSLDGPENVRLRSSTVQTLALALHELTTNSIKHGALSKPEGRLKVRWSLTPSEGAERRLRVEWRESGVAVELDPAGAPPRMGYGRELIERALPYQLNAETTYAISPEGVRCTVALPLSIMQEDGDA